MAGSGGQKAAFTQNSSDADVDVVIVVVAVTRRIHKAIGQAEAVVLLDEDRIPLIVRDCAKPSRNEREEEEEARGAHWQENPLYITRYPPRQWPPRAAPRERIV